MTFQKKAIETNFVDACGHNDTDLYVLVVVNSNPMDTTTIGSGIGTIDVRNDSISYHPVWDIQSWLTSLWMSPSKIIYATSVDGFLWRFQLGKKKSLTQIPICPSNALNALWGTDDETLFVGGANGFLAQVRNGKVYQHKDMNSLSGNITNIFGRSRDDVYAVGDNGVVVHHDGEHWRRLPPVTKRKLLGGLCAPDGNVWLCGDKGLVLMNDEKGKWHRVPGFPENTPLYGMIYFNGTIYIAAAHAGVWKYRDNIASVCMAEYPAYRVVNCGDAWVSLGREYVFRFDRENCIGADLS